jgi:hypothetical protein
MGALRAAECWPAGARGIGSIYRMFRRGYLTSDDEVAVAFSPYAPYPCVSVALVNVRYAVHRAVRTRKLTHTDAVNIINSARDHFYVERNWDSIFRRANVSDPDGGLAEYLNKHDLKKMDAVRAVKCIGNVISGSSYEFDASTARPSHRFLVTRPREATDPVDAIHPQFRRQELWRWLIASGVYRRYAGAGLTISAHRNKLHAVPRESSEVALHRAEWVCGPSSEWAKFFGISTADATVPIQKQWNATLLQHLKQDNTEAARAVWAALLISGDMNQVVLRFLAEKDAAEWARSSGRVARSRHQSAARYAIARSHGFRSWPKLQAALQHNHDVWQWVERYLEDLELIKRVRDELFQATSVTEQLSRFSAEMRRGV